VASISGNFQPANADVVPLIIPASAVTAPGAPAQTLIRGAETSLLNSAQTMFQEGKTVTTEAILVEAYPAKVISQTLSTAKMSHF
jgi:hypothetical protein